jgi:hypothetical protein
MVESLAHRRGRSVVKPNVLDRSDIQSNLPLKHGRERGTVTLLVSQSPRPRAVSVIAEPVPFTGELSDQN